MSFLLSDAKYPTWKSKVDFMFFILHHYPFTYLKKTLKNICFSNTRSRQTESDFLCLLLQVSLSLCWLLLRIVSWGWVTPCNIRILFVATTLHCVAGTFIWTESTFKWNKILWDPYSRNENNDIAVKISASFCWQASGGDCLHIYPYIECGRNIKTYPYLVVSNGLFWKWP